MNVTAKTLLLSAILATASFPAWAEDCDNTSWTALADTDCRGSFVGNINGSPAELTFLDVTWGALTGGTFSYLGKSDDGGSGPFTSNPDVSLNGTLTFDTPITGWFVMGLEAAGNYSYYLFDALSPTSSLTFDSTAGVAVNNSGVPQGLSYATLYAVSAVPVPEPETLALMLAGLSLLGWIGRPRRR